MSMLLGNSALSIGCWLVIKASVLIAIAAGFEMALSRRASAATRHLVWTLALASVLLLPASELVLPAWTLGIRTAPAVATPTASIAPIDLDRRDEPTMAGESATPLPASVEYATPEPAHFPWALGLVGLYVLGAAALL